MDNSQNQQEPQQAQPQSSNKPGMTEAGRQVWKSAAGQSLLKKMFSGHPIEPQLDQTDRQTLAQLKKAR